MPYVVRAQYIEPNPPYTTEKMRIREITFNNFKIARIMFRLIRAGGNVSNIKIFRYGMPFTESTHLVLEWTKANGYIKGVRSIIK